MEKCSMHYMGRIFGQFPASAWADADQVCLWCICFICRCTEDLLLPSVFFFVFFLLTSFSWICRHLNSSSWALSSVFVNPVLASVAVVQTQRLYFNPLVLKTKVKGRWNLQRFVVESATVLQSHWILCVREAHQGQTIRWPWWRRASFLSVLLWPVVAFNNRPINRVGRLQRSSQ